MRKTYQFKLRPTKNQVATMDYWLELLRRQYNYRLAKRFNWWDLNRCDINSCSLFSCSIEKPKEKPSYYSQQNDLPNSKKLFFEYRNVQSQILQDCVKRVDKAYDRFLKADATGKRFGKPRFKGRGRYHSFTFPSMKQDCIKGKQITLPKFGAVKFIQHRQIPNGFKIKTATITKKCNGWYVNLSLEDFTYPVSTSDLVATHDNTVGIDLGLKAFLVTSLGEAVVIPQYYRKGQAKLAHCQRKLSRKKKGSKRRVKAVKRVAKLHQKVANQRKDFHYKTTHWLLGKGQVVAYEDLNIKGMAKSKLAKSINDAGWSSFIQILTVKAESARQKVISVNPHNTSQLCSGCGVKVPKDLSVKIHDCPKCHLSIDRDWNAAINVKTIAVGHPVTAHGGLEHQFPYEVRSLQHSAALSACC